MVNNCLIDVETEVLKHQKLFDDAKLREWQKEVVFIADGLRLLT